MSQNPAEAGPEREMSLLDHLEELRQRLVRCILAAAVGFAVCFAFAERILEVMLHPLKVVLPPKSELITTSLTEGFFVSMKAAFVAGLFLVSPIIFYQVWRFIAPGLYENERKLVVPVAFFTALCFVSGACFGYFVVFPFGFTFLANYAADVVTLMPRLAEYYSFCLGLLLAFGIIFEMPVFIFFLARLGVVDSKWLRNKRRWAVVVFFVVAAILTPTPDAVNQILMAAPMVVLYEISIWVAHFFGKRKPAPEPEGESQEALEGEQQQELPPAEAETETPAPEAATEAAPEPSAPEAEAQVLHDEHTQAELASAEPAEAAPAESGEAAAPEAQPAEPQAEEPQVEEPAAETPAAPAAKDPEPKA